MSEIRWYDEQSGTWKMGEKPVTKRQKLVSKGKTVTEAELEKLDVDPDAPLVDYVMFEDWVE